MGWRFTLGVVLGAAATVGAGAAVVRWLSRGIDPGEFVGEEGAAYVSP